MRSRRRLFAFSRLPRFHPRARIALARPRCLPDSVPALLVSLLGLGGRPLGMAAPSLPPPTPPPQRARTHSTHTLGVGGGSSGWWRESEGAGTRQRTRPYTRAAEDSALGERAGGGAAQARPRPPGLGRGGEERAGKRTANSRQGQAAQAHWAPRQRGRGEGGGVHGGVKEVAEGRCREAWCACARRVVRASPCAWGAGGCIRVRRRMRPGPGRGRSGAWGQSGPDGAGPGLTRLGLRSVGVGTAGLRACRPGRRAEVSPLERDGLRPGWAKAAVAGSVWRSFPAVPSCAWFEPERCITCARRTRASPRPGRAFLSRTRPCQGWRCLRR